MVARTIDFAAFLKHTVQCCDYVIVKLDIESAEYEVLRHLLNTVGVPRYSCHAVSRCLSLGSRRLLRDTPRSMQAHVQGSYIARSG